MLIFGLCLIGFVESWLLSVGLIAEARGYPRLSAVMAFVNTLGWFTVVKLAPEITWTAIPLYALAFATGSYLAVKYPVTKWRSE